MDKDNSADRAGGIARPRPTFAPGHHPRPDRSTPGANPLRDAQSIATSVPGSVCGSRCGHLGILASWRLQTHKAISSGPRHSQGYKTRPRSLVDRAVDRARGRGQATTAGWNRVITAGRSGRRAAEDPTPRAVSRGGECRGRARWEARFPKRVLHPCTLAPLRCARRFRPSATLSRAKFRDATER